MQKKYFPCSSASYETDRRVEGREKAMKGRGRAEAEGGEKRAHAPDRSTTNVSPPWAWGNRRLLTQSAGQSTLDQELLTAALRLEKPASEAQPQHMIIEQQEKARHHCSDSLSFKLALRTHSHSFSLMHTQTHSLIILHVSEAISLHPEQKPLLFLHSCNVAPAAVLKGYGRQTGAFLRGVSFRDLPVKTSGTSRPWRTLSPVLPPPFPRSSAAKDSWCKLVSTWDLSRRVRKTHALQGYVNLQALGW